MTALKVPEPEPSSTPNFALFGGASGVTVLGIIAVAAWCYLKRKDNKIGMGLRRLSMGMKKRMSDAAANIPGVSGKMGDKEARGDHFAVHEHSLNSVEATPDIMLKVNNADQNTTDAITYDFSHVNSGTAKKKKSRAVTLKGIIEPV